MTLEVIKSLGNGGGFLNDRLPRVLTELQGLTISGPLTGTTANTPIPVAEGIDTQDTVVKALMFAGGVPSDITSTISIVDPRASGTVTFTAGLAAGQVVTVNGKAYTAVPGVPSPTLNPMVAPNTFLDGVAVAALPTVAAQKNALVAAGFTPAQAAVIQAGGALAIAAATFAQAINGADSYNLICSYAGAVTTIVSRAEGTAGNAITLGANAANSVRSGANLSGGVVGLPSGTVTLSGQLVGDSVTVDSLVFTATTPGTVLTPFQYVGGTVTATDLTNVGYSQAVAQALITAGNDKAAAALLAHQINEADGARVTANPGLPAEEGQLPIPLTQMTLAQAAAVTNVITVTGNSEYTVLPTLAISARGSVSAATLTASGRGIKSTSATSSNTVVLFWFKKSRVVGQA